MKDKNGDNINDGDILYDGEHYHHFVKEGNYMISCTKGYTHDLTEDMMFRLERIGHSSENMHLLECD